MYIHSEHEGGMYKSIYSRGIGISETKFETHTFNNLSETAGVF